MLRAWVQGRSLDTRQRRAEDFLPLAVRDELPGLFGDLRGLARVHSEHPGEDARPACWWSLEDGQTVESVLLPRDGLCVSTQVGCAVGCVFCMTGRAGLLRQPSSAEIVAQVVLARSRRAVKKVVFMGMGEPAHNLDNVLEAHRALAGGRRHWPQESGLLDRRRPARVRAPASVHGEACPAPACPAAFFIGACVDASAAPVYPKR